MKMAVRTVVRTAQVRYTYEIDAESVAQAIEDCADKHLKSVDEFTDEYQVYLGPYTPKTLDQAAEFDNTNADDIIRGVPRD